MLAFSRSTLWVASILSLTLGAVAQMLTPAQKTDALDTHNRLRRAVSPSAADMNLLTWNSRLEDLAQQAANRCVFEHNYGDAYRNLGENIYQGHRTNMTDIITFFFMEKLAYDFNRRACDLQNSLGLTQCGHYYQLVGASVSEVGCAMAMCGANKYLMFCEYDRMYPSHLYTAGTPCSACPRTAGYCLNGLCVNGSLATDSRLVSKEGAATCSLACKSCGSAVDNRTVSPPVCQCVCPAGFGGNDCSTKLSQSAQLPSGCGACASSGTPCLNSGLETSNTSCRACQCPTNFTGPRCQLQRAAYSDGALLQLRGGLEFCTSGRCARVPLGYGEFNRVIWPALSAVLAAAINAHCRLNPAQCCPIVSTNGAGNLNATTLVSSANLYYVDFSIRTALSGDLEVAVYAVPPALNSFCSSAAAGTGRRKRSTSASSSSLSFSVLSASVNSAETSISSSLGGISVVSVTDYRTTADSLFGYSNTASRSFINAGGWASGIVGALICFAMAVY